MEKKKKKKKKKKKDGSEEYRKIKGEEEISFRRIIYMREE